MSSRLRVAITGTSGRVGSALASRLAGDCEVIALPRERMDLADGESLAAALGELDCDVIVNPAAMTSLEECEDDPRRAMKVNSSAPGRIAEWAAGRGVRMIHFSTDYVFGGETTVKPDESARPDPASAYGRSKLAGERAVLFYPGHLVLRVSWVFGPEKPSFIDQVFAQALAGGKLCAIADKTSLPTYTVDLASWVAELLRAPVGGVLHACNPGSPVSWHGLAEHVVREMRALGLLDLVPEVEPLTLAEMADFRAVRPRFTAMDGSRLASIVSAAPRPWQMAVGEHVRWLAGRTGP